MENSTPAKKPATPKNIVLLGKGIVSLAAKMDDMLEGGFVPPLRLVIEITDANGAIAKSTYSDCKDFPLGGIPDALADWSGDSLPPARNLLLAKEILTAARDTVKDAWCPAGGSQDEFGGYVSSDSLKAVCWGALDAIHRAAGDEEAPGCLEAQVAMERVCGLGKGGGLIAWNDTPGRTLAEVLAKFDAAIAAIAAIEALAELRS